MLYMCSSASKSSSAIVSIIVDAFIVSVMFVFCTKSYVWCVEKCVCLWECIILCVLVLDHVLRCVWCLESMF